MTDALMNTYQRLPVTFTRGEGATLWDEQGKPYLDALSGIAVCGLGHAHPEIARVIADQAATLVHTSNLYGVAHQAALGEILTRLSGMERVFFGNSGAEANEAAIKLARLHGRARNIRNPAIVVMEDSFHGRTMATLSATGNRKVHAGFEPLVQGFIRVPYDDLEALHAVAENRPEIVAVLVEPIQGEGGIKVPSDPYLPGVRALCDKQGWLMMLDEIQTGMGRSGKPFAYQHYDLQPDVLTSAKALGNGLPIGACLARGAAADLFAPGHHGSTFGGNPLVCRAALKVCELLQKDALWERAAVLGERMLQGFRQSLQGLQGVVDIRGRGLLLGIELDTACGGLVEQALEQGLLVNVTAGRVIRLLPPLILSDPQADRIVAQVSTLVRAFLANR